LGTAHTVCFWHRAAGINGWRFEVWPGSRPGRAALRKRPSGLVQQTGGRPRIQDAPAAAPTAKGVRHRPALRGVGASARPAARYRDLSRQRSWAVRPRGRRDAKQWDAAAPPRTRRRGRSAPGSVNGHRALPPLPRPGGLTRLLCDALQISPRRAARRSDAARSLTPPAGRAPCRAATASCSVVTRVRGRGHLHAPRSTLPSDSTMEPTLNSGGSYQHARARATLLLVTFAPRVLAYHT
jgi:hypothetical protein